ncbi:MAG: 3-hydroxybutyryl-CoA dehydrogenase [Rhodobacteraceae bacterium]|nr:3-hydroxybutyryl-CoA dehydrogenase [Paracoccaceae bacterium]
MERLVVVGAGIMGSRICRHFLRRGHPVALVDPSAEALEKAMAFLEPEPRQPIFAGAVDALGQPWRGAFMVIEAVPEVLELKLRVIADIEAFFSDSTIIASNTSGLPTASLTQAMTRPERFVITHFFNPADLIPAVEIVPGPDTPPATVTRVADFLNASGKKAAPLKADVPGFIANRLQHALMRECFALMESGVADAETIDLVTRYSLGVRLALIGPFLQRDLNGLDTHLNIARYLYADLESRQDPPDALADKVAAGDMGRKSGRGFYDWDSAMDRQMAEVERLLPQVIALSAQVDDKDGG